MQLQSSPNYSFTPQKVNGGSFRLGFIAIKISVKHRGIIVIMSSMHRKLKYKLKH